MDVFSGLSSALRMSWTVPIRITGSFVGTLIAVGAIAHLTPLQTLSVVSGWLGFPGPVSATFGSAHLWIVDRRVVFAWIGCVVFCVLLAICGYRDADRAAPVALVGAGLALESGSLVPLVVLGGALVLAAVLAVAARLGNANIYSPAVWSAEWVGRSVGRVLLATLYWVIAPLSWVVRAA